MRSSRTSSRAGSRAAARRRRSRCSTAPAPRSRTSPRRGSSTSAPWRAASASESTSGPRSASGIRAAAPRPDARGAASRYRLAVTETGGRLEGAGSGGDGPHVGHFVPWDGGCLLIGHAGGIVPVHAHYAMQIGFGAAPGIRFRASERDAWTEYVGAIIPSRQPHAMDATAAAPNAVVFVEPETREGRALAARHPTGGIAPVSELELAGAGPALFAAWQDARRAQGSAAAVAAAARRVVRALTGGTETSV